MSGCNGCDMPIAGDVKLSKAMCAPDKGERELMTTRPYRAVVGSLMYLVLRARLDLAYVVRECSQFLENPGIQHWKVAKRALRYVKKTQDYGLEIGGAEHSGRGLGDHLCVFTYADIASRVDDRKAAAGYLKLLYGNVQPSGENYSAPHH
ncbi:hypothetical protein PybrP1_007230 [[Pythium] brassicae (nom. inval.)]|nr:hypothetical protein PybrP1_007230 [[Pythium] brassicae (nom. inval.)]